MSEQDPIDDLPPDLRAMLDLVREPPPLPPEVSDRMLRALDVRVIAEAAAPSTVAGAKPTPGRGPFFRAPWQTLLGFVLGLVLGAAALALLRPAAPPREVVRERVVTRDREVRVEVPVPAPPRVAPPEAPPTPPPDVTERPVPQRHHRGDEGDDLAAEQRLLGPASTALNSGDPARALRLLDEHAARHRRGQLAPERELLRARALVRAGRRSEAEAVAARFRRRYPGHALLPAMNAALR
ncbi:MAG: hypothetical protein U0325_05895 [Polyangiales bacterium]